MTFWRKKSKMTFNYSPNSTITIVCVKCQEIIQNEDKNRMNQVKQCLKNRDQNGYAVYGYSGALNRHMKNDQEEKEARN